MHRSLMPALLLLLLLAGTAEGRGGGTDHWFLDKQGRLTRALPGNQRDLIDAPRERFYRPYEGQLSVHTFTGEKPLWRVAIPLERDSQYRGWLAGDVLVVRDRKTLVAVDTATGKQRYVLAADGREAAMPYARGWDILDDVRGGFYLLRTFAAHTRGPDGDWLPPKATAPGKITRLDPQTGKALWVRAIALHDPQDVIRDVAPGIALGWGGSLAVFDPATGKAGTAPAWRVASAKLGEDQQCFLTQGASPTLRLWRGGKEHWTHPWPKGDYRVAHIDDARAWVVGGGFLFEVDADTGRLQGRYEVPKDMSRVHDVRARRQGELAVLGIPISRQRSELRAIDAQGTRRYTHEHVGLVGVHAGELLLARPQRHFQRPAWDDPKVKPAVLVVATASGKERFRWLVPAPPHGFCDMGDIRILASPNGYLVTRGWTVLD